MVGTRRAGGVPSTCGALAMTGAVALALGACTARAIGTQCAYSDQCAAGLVCAGGACRAACESDRDCAGGAACRASGVAPGGRACVPPDAPPLCLTMADCAPPAVCGRDGVCHAQCATARDCAVRAPWLAGASCSDAGVCERSAVTAGIGLRLLAPLSGSLVGEGDPAGLTLHWVAPTVDSFVVFETCNDHVCNFANGTGAPGGQFTLRTLTPGVQYWRVRAFDRTGMTELARTPVWQFTVVRGTQVARGTSARPWLFHDADDRPDLLVGAPRSASAAGRADIFRGDPALRVQSTSAAQITASTPLVGELFGSALANVGDLNGDGFADVAVMSAGATRNLYVHAGSAVGLATMGAVVENLSTIAVPVVAAAGDVNGDGRADLLVGDAAAASLDVIVAHGVNGTMLASVTERLPDPMMAAEGFGAAVAGAGDVNGDGVDDVIIGAPLARSMAGVVYTYQGARMSGLPGLPSATLIGDGTAGVRFGSLVAGVGDVDGDGFADVGVIDHPASGPPHVWVYRGGFGGLTAFPSAPLTLTLPMGAPAGAMSATAIAALGDANADGYSDFAVGAPDTSGRGYGRVVVYYGGPSGPIDARATGLLPLSESATAPSLFGLVITGPGDLDGDGYADLAVGAPGAGRVDVFPGARGGYGASRIAMLPAGGMADGFGAALPR